MTPSYPNRATETAEVLTSFHQSGDYVKKCDVDGEFGRGKIFFYGGRAVTGGDRSPDVDAGLHAPLCIYPTYDFNRHVPRAT